MPERDVLTSMDYKIIMHIAEAAGGIDRYLNLFIDNFDNDYKHIVVLSQNFNLKKYYSKPNVLNVEILEMKHNIGFSDFKTIKKIKQIIKKYKPDFIYCHSTKAGFLGRLAKPNNSLLLYNAHGWIFNRKCNKFKKTLYALMERILAKKTDKIVCISKSEYNSALKYKICKKDKLICIYNGIDYNEITKIVGISREKIGYTEKNKVIGMVGRLCEQKGSDIFINVAQKLIYINKDYRFLLIGGGPQESKIKEMIEDKGLSDYVKITGWVNNPLSYAKILDVACLFSRWEGFGYAIEEYKAMHLPIVASNVDAIPELLDETYDINNIDELVEVINSKSNMTKINYTNRFLITDCTSKHKELFSELYYNK